MKSNVYNIVQYLNHPETGEELINIQKVEEVLNSHKSITRWAYIVHNEDIYTEEEAEEQRKELEKKKKELEELTERPEGDLTFKKKGEMYLIQARIEYLELFPIVVGKPKPPHIHIVLWCEDWNVTTKQLGKWLDFPENFIEVPKRRKRKGDSTKGHGQLKLYDCLKYLTHEEQKQQDLGKHLYQRTDVVASFDYSKFLDDFEMEMKLYGEVRTEEQKVFDMVLYEGKTPKYIRTHYPALYRDNYKKINEMRDQYVHDEQLLPLERYNIYIGGKSGYGKTQTAFLLSEIISEEYYPEYTIDREKWFKSGTR